MRQLVISEQDNVAALMEDGKAIDFYISKNEYSVGDVYSVLVENIMPSINAVFVKIADGQMGFLHANDIPGRGDLYNRISPGQRLLVQIVKEPTGNKGPRVNLAISIPGRYYVLTSETNSISISRRISENAERDRLRSITNLMKPEELGVVIRTEAAGRTQEELEEDFLNIWEKWKNIVDKYERTASYAPIHKDSDFLYSILRDAFNSTIDEVSVGGVQSKYRCEEYLKTWTGRSVNVNSFETSELLAKTDVLKELKNCLSNRVNLPSGGYIIIQGMEALTAVDINSGKFTSSSTLRETVRRTNMEAAIEIARQMRLRNIGGMIIVDFIDMSERSDRIAVMEVLEAAVKSDKAKPQIGQLSDLCLTEITRKRSGQALAEIFGTICQHCNGTGVTFNLRGAEDHSSHGRRNDNRQQRFNQNQRSSSFSRDNRDRDNRDRDNRDSSTRDNRDSSTRDNRDSSTRDNRDSSTRDNRDSSNRDSGRDRNNNRRDRNNNRNNRFSSRQGSNNQGQHRRIVRDDKPNPDQEGSDLLVASDLNQDADNSSGTDSLTRSKSFGASRMVEARPEAASDSRNDSYKNTEDTSLEIETEA
jgi:ribonuclease E